MEYSKLTWYDLNELWVIVRQNMVLQEQNLNKSDWDEIDREVLQANLDNTKSVLDKIKQNMRVLEMQQFPASNYELRIVDKMDNTVK